ncbi:MAG: hypothetical protein IRZ20_07760 [Thermoleophilia bacterium]|nr:hypothetical protein [Thermoleophilia bacterium]
MSLATASDAVELTTPTERRGWAERILAALPLASVYVVLSFVYAVESWARVTPWLFGDELELTQLARSIAATGHAARRGEPHAFDSLYTYLTAPFWLIHDVGAAYASIKYLDVFVMTSVVFPTYLLARLVVRRNWALFAGAGAAAIPSLAYSSYIAEETLAYPYAALCLYLIAKALVELRGRRRWRWAGAAILASAVAPLVRGELVVVPGILVLSALFAAWSSEWARRWRRSWSVGDYVGAVVLVLGAIFVVSAIGSHQSQEWYAVTTYYKHRALNMGGWAAGCLAIATGVLPFVAGLAALVRLPGEEPSRPIRMLRCTSLAGLVAFGLYTAMKAAYLSTTFATRVEERNLIYVAPLLFVGTALVLERRRVNAVALAASGAFAFYLVSYATYHAVGSPYEMGVQLYSDALGFAILQGANRYLHLSIDEARVLLVAVALAAVVLLRAPSTRLLRGRESLAGKLMAVAAAVVLAWNLTGEIAAAAGTVSISRQFADHLRRPFSWVDAVTGGQPTLYVAEGESDHTAAQLLEFWNRSITRVTSFDGTAGGPGPAGSPNVDPTGVLLWNEGPSRYRYAVESRPCVELAGRRVAEHHYSMANLEQTWWLVELARPNRVVATCTGISPDGWSGATDSQYLRFSGGRGGWVKVVVSRLAWSGPSDPSPVHVLVAALRVDNGYPSRGRVLRQLDGTIDSGQQRVFWVRSPAERFAIQVVVDKKFVPAEVDPARFSDTRQLGAQVSYTFVRRR